MTAPPMSATSTPVTARCGAAQEQKDPVADGSNQARGGDSSASDNHVFKEPVMKEKLKYLRYFRLVTHRKKNGKCS